MENESSRVTSRWFYLCGLVMVQRDVKRCQDSGSNDDSQECKCPRITISEYRHSSVATHCAAQPAQTDTEENYFKSLNIFSSLDLPSVAWTVDCTSFHLNTVCRDGKVHFLS